MTTPGDPAPPPEPPAQSISAAAAIAVLDVGEQPSRPGRRGAPSPPIEPSPPVEPSSPVETPRLPSVSGAPVGVVRGAKRRRTRTDAVVYDGLLVLASRGAPMNLLGPQLAAQDPSSRLVDAGAVDDVTVREDRFGGKASIRLHSGEVIVLTWPGRKNRGTSVENLLTYAFPSKVDQGPSDIAQRSVRVMAMVGAVMLAMVGAWMGLSVLLRSDPPPPPAPTPAPTLAPAELAARAELDAACAPWVTLAASVPRGQRPDPVALRPIVDSLRPRFDAAAQAGADPSYASARDEVAYLQDYARRSPEAIRLESVSRVAWAMRAVSAACARATSGP